MTPICAGFASLQCRRGVVLAAALAKRMRREAGNAPGRSRRIAAHELLELYVSFLGGGGKTLKNHPHPAAGGISVPAALSSSITSPLSTEHAGIHTRADERERETCGWPLTQPTAGGVLRLGRLPYAPPARLRRTTAHRSRSAGHRRKRR